MYVSKSSNIEEYLKKRLRLVISFFWLIAVILSIPKGFAFDSAPRDVLNTYNAFLKLKGFSAVYKAESEKKTVAIKIFYKSPDRLRVDVDDAGYRGLLAGSDFYIWDLKDKTISRIDITALSKKLDLAASPFNQISWIKRPIVIDKKIAAFMVLDLGTDTLTIAANVSADLPGASWLDRMFSGEGKINKEGGLLVANYGQAIHKIDANTGLLLTLDLAEEKKALKSIRRTSLNLSPPDESNFMFQHDSSVKLEDAQANPEMARQLLATGFSELLSQIVKREVELGRGLTDAERKELREAIRYYWRNIFSIDKAGQEQIVASIVAGKNGRQLIEKRFFDASKKEIVCKEFKLNDEHCDAAWSELVSQESIRIVLVGLFEPIRRELLIKQADIILSGLRPTGYYDEKSLMSVVEDHIDPVGQALLDVLGPSASISVAAVIEQLSTQKSH